MNRLTRSVTVAALLMIVAPSISHAQAGREAYERGLQYLQQNDGAKAEREFERAIKLEKGVGVYHMRLAQAIGVQASEASVVRQPFMARRIKAEFERALALDPELIDARDGLIQFHLMAPGVMGGNPAQAREQQREIAKRNAVRGHQAQANIAWHAKDTVATEKALRAAIQAAPDSARPVLLLAARQMSWQRPSDAIATYDAFLARHPTNVAVRYQVARWAVVTQQQLPRAERYLRALAAEDAWEPAQFVPSRALVRARLGDVLRLQGKSADARKEYEAALALDRDLTLARDGLKALN